MIEGWGCLAHYLLTARHYESNQRKLSLKMKCSKQDEPLYILTPDYPVKTLFEGFLTDKSADSIDDLTNKADISKLEINELPP